MSSFSAIDLSKLPPPNVVEPLDFEAIFEARKQTLIDLKPELAEALELGSEPLAKFLEEVALRELLLRQRVNEASRAVMLPYATGADLENLASFYGVERDIVEEGDPTASPPVPDVHEDDARLRERIQLSLEGFSTAGPVGAYIFHAKSADGRVKDVSVDSPAPGAIAVTILSTLGNGAPSDELGVLVPEVEEVLSAVRTVLNHDDVRPLTDKVTVSEATILPYEIEATLYYETGPGSDKVRQTAEVALQEYIDKHHRLGNKITLSGLHAALHQPGVAELNLKVTPSELIDAEVTVYQALYCTRKSIQDGGLANE